MRAKDKNRATITILGSGTSQGVPVIACRCAVCRSGDKRDKRLRTSAMVEVNGCRFVIDAGPDFRQQMLREGVESLDAILLTHEHKDHIGGIDDVRAFNHSSRSAIDIYATRRVQRIVKKDFDYAFNNDRYPGAPAINLITIGAGKNFSVNDSVPVTPIEGHHYRVPVLGFRIGSLAYLTDFNSIEQGEIDKLKGLDILIINALCHTPHISHFTLEQAIEISRHIAPKRTYLTHASHNMGLYSYLEPTLPKGVHLAYDGLVLEFEMRE